MRHASGSFKYFWFVGLTNKMHILKINPIECFMAKTIIRNMVYPYVRHITGFAYDEKAEISAGYMELFFNWSNHNILTTHFWEKWRIL